MLSGHVALHIANVWICLCPQDEKVHAVYCSRSGMYCHKELASRCGVFYYLFPQALLSNNGLLPDEQILYVLWRLLTECSLLLSTPVFTYSVFYLFLSECVKISLCCFANLCANRSHATVNRSAHVKWQHHHSCHTLNNEIIIQRMIMGLCLVQRRCWCVTFPERE